MKVGLVIHAFDPLRGGVEQWTSQFANWLCAAGHEVHVIARDYRSDAAPKNMRFHKVESAQKRLGFAQAAEVVIGKLNLDIVHDTGCGWTCDVFQPHGGSRTAAFEQNLLLLPKWQRALRRMSTAFLPRYREFRELTERQYANDGRTFVAISQMVARDLARDYGTPAERVRLVYNGVDCERFSPDHQSLHRAAGRKHLRAAESDVVLSIVAHNFALKGVATLIRAAAILVGEGHSTRVVVAGGKRTGKYATLAKRLNLEDRVTFLGLVQDVAPWYAASDIYVQPTFYDPCSLVVLEALASGLPVVTSRFNGAGELITPKVEGNIVRDPGNAEELAKTLRPMMDLKTRCAMGVAARKAALAHTLERNCREMLAVYEEILQRRIRRAA